VSRAPKAPLYMLKTTKKPGLWPGRMIDGYSGPTTATSSDISTGLSLRWSSSARSAWQLRNGPALSLNLRHVEGVKLADDVSPLETHVSAQDYFDVTALFRVRDEYVLRIGARNIFDRAPPIVTSLNPACFSTIGGCAGNTFPQLYDPLGRYVFASVTFNFKPRF